MIGCRAIVMAACVCAPLSLHAAMSTNEENCSAFRLAVAERVDLTEDEKGAWLASPNIWRGFTWENDGYAAGGDRHYTNGMKLSWVYNPCRGKLKFLEAAWRRVHGEDDSQTNRFYTGGVFGMNMFTPTDIRAAVRQRFDRPYVGWTYGGLQVQRQTPDPTPAASAPAKGWGAGVDVLELQFGIVGPAAGQGPIQEWWHRDVGTSEKMPHWEFQVPDYLGLNAVYTKSRHYWLNDRRSWRATFFGGGALGNVMTFVNAGAALAFGNPGESFIASSTIQPSGVPVTARLEYEPAELSNAKRERREPRPMRRAREWSVFAGVDHRYIARSVFIEGRGEAEHDIELVRHVYDVFFGFSAQFWKSHSLTYKRLKRSVEFHSANPAVVRPHTLGQFAYEMKF